jgi:hypothetical protein
MAADPEEMHNLAADTANKLLLNRYREEMTRFRKQQNDTITGPEIIKTEQRKPGTKPIAPYVFLD